MDWYEALGVKPESGQTDPGEETAEDTAAGTEQEPGQDAEESVQQPQEQPQDAAAEEGDEGAQETAKQSRQENARYAAARRKAEQERDAAIAQVRQEAAREIDRIIEGMGLKNPYSNKNITNRAELTEYQQQHEQRRQEQIQRKLDMDDEEFNRMVEDLPAVKQAKARAAEADRVQQQWKAEQVRKQVEREMAEISTINPAIKDAADLARDEKYEQILDYVQKGLSIAESYKLAHIDDLSRRTGRQQAINQAGKAHMSSTQARGDGALSVPSDENYWYRALNPKATDGRIAEHYNKLHRK